MQYEGARWVPRTETSFVKANGKQHDVKFSFRMRTTIPFVP